MQKKRAFLIFFILIFTLLFNFPSLLKGEEIEKSKSVFLYFFWGNGCPHCSQAKPFLEELKKKYPPLEIKSYEVWYSKENADLFNKLSKAYNSQIKGVPTFFIGDFPPIIGYSENRKSEIEEKVIYCLKNSCPDPLEKIQNPTLPNSSPTSSTVFSPVLSSEKQKLECIYLFINDNCPQCEALLPFIEKIAQKYNLDLEIYNVKDKGNLELYNKLQQFYGLNYSGFPMVFLGNTYLVGDERIKDNLENIIKECLRKNCPCPVSELKQTLTQMPNPKTFTPEEKTIIKFNLLNKEFKISSKNSLLLAGLILGLADGINPCTFSVLIFLLSYLLAIGSPRRALKIGFVFVIGVFLAYFLFMLGLLNLISIISFIQKIKITVGIIALISGILMVKDFFFYGKGISLEIPKFAKPTLEKLMKKGTLPSAFILSIFASLVDLPCTSGLPLVYTTILAQKNVIYQFYLLWYNFFFVLPLIIIILLIGFAFTKAQKIEKWRLSFRRYMRLISGSLLLILAYLLLKQIL
jgi:cytochrome c biogenesis protein CcdA/glutaredoxin